MAAHPLAPSAQQHPPTWQHGPPPQHVARRRALLAAPLLLLAPGQLRGAAAATEAEVLLVGPGRQYGSIAAAVAAAPEGAAVLVDAGRYSEQLVLGRSVRIAAAAAGSVVEVVCDSQQPYRHCLEVQGAGVQVVVQGLAFSHYSKSVANNYAVFAQGGCLTLLDCDVSSRSGVGVGVEGARARLQRCSIHGCERHGVAVFCGLDGSVGACGMSGCSISDNKLNGVLARGGADVALTDSRVQRNGGFGVQLSDCSAAVSGCCVNGNAAGSVAIDTVTVSGVDADTLQLDNELQAPVQLL